VVRVVCSWRYGRLWRGGEISGGDLLPADVAIPAMLRWLEWLWGAPPAISPIKGLGAGPGASDLLLHLLPRLAVEAREV
jgi:hypothetical protein